MPLIDIANINIKIQNDPSRMRPSDIPIYIGDNTKIKSMLNWAPLIDTKTTLADMIEWWLQKL